MKKYLLILLLLITTGCSSSRTASNTQKVSCTYADDSISIEVNASAKDSTIQTIVLNVITNKNHFEGIDFNTLSEEEKDKIATQYIEQLGIKDAEGITYQIEFTDTMEVTFNVDLNTVSPESLKKLGFDLSDQDLNIDTFKSGLIDSSYTCQ